MIEAVESGEAVPSPGGQLPQDQRSNLPVVRKKERDYMGMFEYRKEDEQIIVKHLVYGMNTSTYMYSSFVCYLFIPKKSCLESEVIVLRAQFP